MPRANPYTSSSIKPALLTRYGWARIAYVSLGLKSRITNKLDFGGDTGNRTPVTEVTVRRNDRYTIPPFSSYIFYHNFLIKSIKSIRHKINFLTYRLDTVSWSAVPFISTSTPHSTYFMSNFIYPLYAFH